MKTMLKILSVLAVLVLTAALAPMAAQAESPVTAVIKTSVTVTGTQPSAPETYKIRLTPEGMDFPMPGGLTGGTADLSITGPGSGTFPAISFARIGIYTYKIRMVAGTSAKATYDTTVYDLKITVYREGDALALSVALREEGTEKKLDRCSFTVEYAAPSEMTSMRIRKVWEDGNNKNRPKTLNVILAGDGKAVRFVTLSEENEWTARVDNLPVYDDNGLPILYVWKEDDIPGYTLSFTDYRIMEDGILETILTNELKKNPPSGGARIPELEEADVGMFLNIGDCIE